MRWETKRNFLGGSAVLVIIAIFGLIGAFSKKDCTSDSRTVLVLVDFTDDIGVDARNVIKDKVWEIIERAPDFSRVVFKRISGDYANGLSSDADSQELCRVEKLSAKSPITGPTVKIKARWKKFKDEVCGESSNENDNCGAAVRSERKKSFFDKAYPSSASSPIVEKVVDYSRQYLTNIPHAWDLVIVTDWKEYTPQLDLHTKPCVSNDGEYLKSVNSLVPRGEKLFTGPVDSSGKNTINSLFVLRHGMTNVQAQCLDAFGQAFVMTNIDDDSVSKPEFHWLPRTKF